MGEGPEDNKDDLAEYRFPQFAATYFQRSASHTHVRKPLRYPLLYHEDDADCLVPWPLVSAAQPSPLLLPAPPPHPLPPASALWFRATAGVGPSPGFVGSQQASVSPPAGCPGCVESHSEVHGRHPRACALHQDAASPGHHRQGGQRPAFKARICTGTWVRVVAERANTLQAPISPSPEGSKAQSPLRLTLQPEPAPAPKPDLSRTQQLRTSAVMWSLLGRA